MNGKYRGGEVGLGSNHCPGVQHHASRAPSSGQPWITRKFSPPMAPTWGWFAFGSPLQRVLDLPQDLKLRLITFWMCFSFSSFSKTWWCPEALFCFAVKQYSTNDHVDKIRDGLGLCMGNDPLCCYAGLPGAPGTSCSTQPVLPCAPVKPQHTAQSHCHLCNWLHLSKDSLLQM